MPKADTDAPLDAGDDPLCSAAAAGDLGELRELVEGAGHDIDVIGSAADVLPRACRRALRV